MSDPENSNGRWVREAFETHHRALFAYALRLTSGKHDRAEEAVQETFLRLCRQSTPAGRSQLRAWLFRVCRTRIIDMQRTDHAAPQSQANSGGEFALPNQEREDPAAGPVQVVLADEAQQRLQREIASLAPRQRELLHLKVHAGLSYREIAETLEMSVSSVGFQLHQAMQTLRQKMRSGEVGC